MTDRRAAVLASLTALTGALLSGPVSIWMVSITHPQPAWRDVDTFIQAYHPIQTLPYFTGFLLVGGFLTLIGSLHQLAPDHHRDRTIWGVGFASAFAAMIFINYAIQTTFVPALVHSPNASDRSLIGALTMANPRSLGWSLEMWGYAVLGVATWCSAAAFEGGRLARTTASLFTANGPISLGSAMATALWPGWVSSSVGFALFIAWNVLIVAMTACATMALRSPVLARRPASPAL